LQSYLSRHRGANKAGAVNLRANLPRGIKPDFANKKKEAGASFFILKLFIFLKDRNIKAFCGTDKPPLVSRVIKVINQFYKYNPACIVLSRYIRLKI
jgi:hypothetical protein